jgi:hypothetical protein
MQQLIVREDYWSLTNEALDIGWKQVVGKPFKLSSRSRQESSTVQDSHQNHGYAPVSCWKWQGDLQYMALGKKKNTES